MNQTNFINNKQLSISGIIKFISIILLIGIIAVTLIKNVLIVQENEIVLIKNYDKIVRIIDKPGIYFKIPIIQTTSIVAKNLLLLDSQPIKVLTNDKQSILFENLIIWKVNNAHKFISSLQTILAAEIKIENTLFSNLSQNAGKFSFEQIMSDKPSKNNFDLLIIGKLKNELSQYGIEIVDYKIKRAYIPKENEESIYSRMKSERKRIAAEYISKGEKQATEIKAEADKEAKIILSKASSYSEELKGKADAEAAKLYAESYNQDPEFYKFIRTLESYKKTLKGKPTIVIPINSPYAKYLLGE